jgi:hypothetical protein
MIVSRAQYEADKELSEERAKLLDTYRELTVLLKLKIADLERWIVIYREALGLQPKSVNELRDTQGDHAKGFKVPGPEESN